jgi:hypothetical protein
MDTTNVFLGMSDIASQISDLKKSFDKKGLKAYAIVEETHAVTQNRKVDRVVSAPFFFNRIRPYRLQKYIRNIYWNNDQILDQVIDHYDVFIFMWRSIRPDGKDLVRLKEKGKKIVVFFVGSDVRWITSYEQEMFNYTIPSYLSRVSDRERRHEYIALNSKLHYLRMVEQYADLIYNLPNQGQLALRPYFHFFVPVATDEIEENATQRQVPVVIHAPSRRSAKGTDIILAVFDQLKKEGVPFEVKLIENMPYERALREYTQGDILVGELYVPSAGKLDREALAAGCVVLSSMRYDYIDKTPQDCPIIDVNPDTLYDELKKIILDYPRRVDLAKQGRPYVNRYHDVNVVADTILYRLKNNPEHYDYNPVFYRECFIPGTSKEISVLNKYNESVSHCDWYVKHIAKGTREGLIF